MKWVKVSCCLSLALFFSRPSRPGQGLLTLLPPQPGAVGCSDIPSQKPAEFVYNISAAQMPSANKKVELLNLLRQSLRNEATKIDGEDHAPVLDLKLEKKIRKLPSEISRN